MSTLAAVDCVTLEKWLLFGCPGGPTCPGPTEPVLLDELTRCGRAVLAIGGAAADVLDGRRVLFRDWFVTTGAQSFSSVCHSDATAILGRLADVVVDWLQFAHLGDVTESTPSWWVLAWAGYPLDNSVVQGLASCDDARCVHQWLDKFASVGEGPFEAWLTSVVPRSVGVDHEAMRGRVVGWVASTAALAEVTPWKDW